MLPGREKTNATPAIGFWKPCSVSSLLLNRGSRCLSPSFCRRLVLVAKQVTTTTDLVVTAVPEHGEMCDVGGGIELE